MIGGIIGLAYERYSNNSRNLYNYLVELSFPPTSETHIQATNTLILDKLSYANTNPIINFKQALQIHDLVKDILIITDLGVGNDDRDSTINALLVKHGFQIRFIHSRLKFAIYRVPKSPVIAVLIMDKMNTPVFKFFQKFKRVLCHDITWLFINNTLTTVLNRFDI